MLFVYSRFLNRYLRHKVQLNCYLPIQASSSTYVYDSFKWQADSEYLHLFNSQDNDQATSIPIGEILNIRIAGYDDPIIVEILTDCSKLLLCIAS